jgi:hypothetical protein
LRERDVAVVEANSADDGQAVVLSDPSLQGVLLDWILSDDDPAHDKAKTLIDLIRSLNPEASAILSA